MLALSGMAPAVWNMLGQRNAVPFERDRRRERNTYGADDALRLMLFVELTAGGKVQEQSAAWVRSELTELLEDAKTKKGRGDWYFGAIAFTGRDDEGPAARLHQPILVRLADLDDRVQSIVKLAKLDPSELTEVFIVNLSSVVRGLMQRGRSIGVDQELSEIAWLAGDGR